MTARRLTTGDEARARDVALTFKSADVPAEHAARFLADPAHVLVVAEAAGELAGFLLAYRLERLDRAGAQLFVYEIDVAPAHRRRGIGTRLMEYVRRLVDQESLMEAFVFTSRDNAPAVSPYTGTGGKIEEDGGVLFVYPGPTTGE
ncbi:MAG: GNAT family N-acetyltransferase [bacterium]